MSIQPIIEAIKQYDTIIIHRHVRPDPDAYGSQAGLKEVIQSSFPNKKVYIVGEEDPSLNYLVRMDEIEDQTYENALVIVCDTANTERVCDKRYDRGDKLIKIDHHPNVDPYGDIQWVDTSASSTSEMIYEFYSHAKHEGFKLNDAGARLIYAGIVGDTGRFLFPSTTNRTFQIAADLVTYQFDRSELYDGIYNVSEKIARLRGFILHQFTLFPSGMSTIKLTKEVLDEFHVTPLETGQLVPALGDIEGMKAWVFFIEEEDQIRVRFRSKGPIINDIAAKYGGGGHPLAAGASIQSWEEAEQVIADVEQACLAYK